MLTLQKEEISKWFSTKIMSQNKDKKNKEIVSLCLRITS